MKSFGDSLKQAREARGLALDSIARYTRISLHYLDALERTDLKALPGGAFNQGYIRSYAEVLGIDPAPLLESYSEEARRLGLGTAESQQKMIQELSRIVDRRAASKRRSALGLRAVVVAGIALFAIAIGAGLVMSIRDRGIDGAPEPEARVESAPKPEPENVPQGLPESRPAPTSPESRSGLSIPSSGVGTAVVEHKLVGESDRFPGGTVVCFWTRVVGAKSDETIRHVWKREGRTVMVRRLNIRSAHWRTYSRYALPENDSATWVVEAQTADGSVLLAREEFLSFAPVPATPESTEDRPPHGIDESVHEGGRE